MFKAQCWRKKQLPYDLSALHNSAGFPAGRKEKETELVERTGSIATAWGKMKKRKEIPELHPNRAFTYFVEQNFPIKIKLDDLLGRKVSKYEKMPCYGGLQRKQLPFD